jgi:hypothetical protein
VNAVQDPNLLSFASQAGIWLTVGLIGICAGSDRGRADPLAVARVPLADEPSIAARPSFVPRPYDLLPVPEAADEGNPMEGQDFPGHPVTPDAETPPRTGLLDLIGESMFADRGESWRPLPLRMFFSEGWNEPWSSSPRSSTGAPRQAWINAFDGVFYRLFLVSFSYVDDFEKNGSGYAGEYVLFAPISRRFQLRFNVPFVVSNRGGPGNNYQSNFGDFAVTPRFLLSESQDFSQVFQLMFRTPTGSTVNGNGQTTLSPLYEFWYGGLPGGGVIRGGTGLTVPTSGTTGSRTLYKYNLAFGKYWTPHDARPGNFVTYLSINGFTTLDDRGPTYSYLSFTPGLRFHLGAEYYLSAGVEVPVTGPKTQNFAWSPIFWITKVW